MNSRDIELLIKLTNEDLEFFRASNIVEHQLYNSGFISACEIMLSRIKRLQNMNNDLAYKSDKDREPNNKENS